MACWVVTNGRFPARCGKCYKLAKENFLANFNVIGDGLDINWSSIDIEENWVAGAPEKFAECDSKAYLSLTIEYEVDNRDDKREDQSKDCKPGNKCTLPLIYGVIEALTEPIFKGVFLALDCRNFTSCAISEIAIFLCAHLAILLMKSVRIRVRFSHQGVKVEPVHPWLVTYARITLWESK